MSNDYKEKWWKNFTGNLWTPADLGESKSTPKKKSKPIDEKKPNPKLRGYVYLMRAETGYYKIGHSINPIGRRHELLRQIPIKIELVHQFLCQDRYKAEKLIHNKHRKKWKQREWFALDPEDVEWFMSLKDGDMDIK